MSHHHIINSPTDRQRDNRDKELGNNKEVYQQNSKTSVTLSTRREIVLFPLNVMTTKPSHAGNSTGNRHTDSEHVGEDDEDEGGGESAEVQYLLGVDTPGCCWVVHHVQHYCSRRDESWELGCYCYKKYVFWNFGF